MRIGSAGRRGTVPAAVLALALLAGSAGAAQTEVGTPMDTWAVGLDLQGFVAKSDETGKDWRSRQVYFEHQDGRTRLTLVIKPAVEGATAVAIRDDRRGEIARKPHNEAFETSDGQGHATVRYVNETPFSGTPLHARNVHRFWVHEGMRVEVHVSVGPSFTPAEDARIHTWLDGVRVPAPARAASYTDKERGFALDLPSGWTLGPGGPSGLELRGGGEAVALLFEQSSPGHWTVPLLMSAQETAIRSSAIDAPAAETRASVGWSGPVEVRVYPQVGVDAKMSPVAGVVVLERGGVVLVGLLHKASTAEQLARILASVRPIPGK